MEQERNQRRRKNDQDSEDEEGDKETLEKTNGDHGKDTQEEYLCCRQTHGHHDSMTE